MSSTMATGEQSTVSGGALSEDEVFEVLSNRRRRYVVHALKRAQEPIELSDLSKRVTAWEVDIDPGEVRYEDRRNVYSTLQRTHLPKMEEKNLVRVDEEENVVRPTPKLEDLDIYVEVLQSQEIPWSLYYVGLAGVTTALLLAVAAGTPGLGALSPIDVGAFTVTAFGMSSLVQYVVGQRTRLGTSERPPELEQV
ncbi:DUF7344 domain-containing protein [Halobellus litoreus]|uniref:Transcriptional regulator n=1 Tax=Halobellus litoreus TaxID=755310 RepID=A0ABD6DUL4_9EURY|nr:transcriptional regulator [Halobellus litoreus]